MIIHFESKYLYFQNIIDLCTYLLMFLSILKSTFLCNIIFIIIFIKKYFKKTQKIQFPRVTQKQQRISNVQILFYMSYFRCFFKKLTIRQGCKMYIFFITFLLMPAVALFYQFTTSDMVIDITLFIVAILGILLHTHIYI